jgi:hypothetical protein
MRLASSILLLLPWLSAQTVINDDGAWSWFQDERAVFHSGKLIVGSVASGGKDSTRRGDVEVTVYDPASGQASRTALHRALLDGRGRYDDHNAPALLALPDGRLLAVYAAHGGENRFYHRARTPAGEWEAEQQFVPSEKSRITYSNLHYLSAEKRIYNFYRGYHDSFKPSFAWSDDFGSTWTSGGVFVDVPAQFRHRPYVKYAANGRDTIHIFYTEGHPRNFDNSAYHVFYRRGKLHRSDGARIRALAEGLRDPAEGTRIFAGDAHNVAWVSDIHLDRRGRPYVAYSVQKNSAGLPPGQGGDDHRYRWARWTGARWEDYEIAFAGRRLYAGEDDYTGNIALDPDDPSVACISTNVDPVTGRPLPGGHYEIFEGRARNNGRSWRWTAVTENSTADNIRPIIPKSDGKYRAVLWLRGTYRSYTDYDLAVVGRLVRD